MRFVHHRQVPRHTFEVVRLGLGELVRADDDAIVLVKRVRLTGLAQLVVVFGFQYEGLQAELVLQLLVPLLAQVGRHDDQDVSLALCPALGDDQTCFYRLAQPYFIRKNHSFRQRAFERE